MAQKFIKLIQNGNVSYQPDTPSNRSFLITYNKRVSKSKNASEHLVTVLPATEEETAFMTVQPVATQSASAGITMEVLELKLKIQALEIEKQLLERENQKIRSEAAGLDNPNPDNSDTGTPDVKDIKPDKSNQNGKQTETKTK